MDNGPVYDSDAERQVSIAVRGRDTLTEALDAGDGAKLDEAVDLLQQARAAFPHDHPLHAEVLSDLGFALRIRFERTGRTEDLEEAIDALRQVANAIPQDHPARPQYLVGLGLALRIRFERSGRMEDLEEAIAALRQAVESAPQEHPHRPRYLADLGLALRIRFERTGEIEGLNWAPIPRVAGPEDRSGTREGVPRAAGHGGGKTSAGGGRSTRRGRYMAASRGPLPSIGHQTRGHGAAESLHVSLYPRVDGPGVVVVGQAFELVVGVSPRRNRSLITTGAIKLPASALVELGLLVTYDPDALRLEGVAPTRLVVDTDNPEDAVTVRFTVLDGEDLAAERRVGVHYLRDGVPLGIAWKTVIAVSSEAELARTVPPVNREGQLLDLAPIIHEKSPDLIVAVYRADDVDDRKFIWAAYPSMADFTVPDLERSSNIGDDAQQFATNWRRTIEIAQHPRALFTQLHGLGLAIGRAIPLGIRQVLHRLATVPGRTTAATVLLLTEEVHVPWELAAFKAPHALQTGFGGQSPFLGAHLAVSRWPLTDDQPRPVLRTAVEVRRTAVISARYEGVPGWGRIPHAEQEALDLLQAYQPAVMVDPFFDAVMDCLNGSPPGEVLHFALHGQFDPEGNEEGLVVFTADRTGTVRLGFLTPLQVDATTVPGAFVFLNACQVGAAKQVLGDYAGFAVAFLRAGASGVIAPLWNIDDVVAGTVARDFYTMVYGPEEVPVAEALRQLRARYTEKTAQETLGTGGATYLAYQFFGHPRFTLARIAAGQLGGP